MLITPIFHPQPNKEREVTIQCTRTLRHNLSGLNLFTDSEDTCSEDDLNSDRSQQVLSITPVVEHYPVTEYVLLETAKLQQLLGEPSNIS